MCTRRPSPWKVDAWLCCRAMLLLMLTSAFPKTSLTLANPKPPTSRRAARVCVACLQKCQRPACCQRAILLACLGRWLEWSARSPQVRLCFYSRDALICLNENYGAWIWPRIGTQRSRFQLMSSACVAAKKNFHFLSQSMKCRVWRTCAGGGRYRFCPRVG